MKIIRNGVCEGVCRRMLMPVAKVYTKSQWEAFASALDALPERPETERLVSMSDAMKDMRARVRAAQAKGYTLEQIAEQAKPHGIDITASTIRYALRVAAKGSVSANGARAPGQTGGPTARAPDPEPRTNQARKQGGKAVPRQPMPVQGALGFAIRPDTDDL
ncbi:MULTISPECIES: hypothetical protein [Paraburkholderia]|uniref:hypothetical protein n=1 Tax=Paraburkholderia TaxID=1822464 RepID=UPI00210AF176|nr:hypothetical protein [Paraburkholderia nodosa]